MKISSKRQISIPKTIMEALDLKPGDEVTIQAFCYKLAGQERLLASEIEHKGNTLRLCDAQGTPNWKTCPSR